MRTMVVLQHAHIYRPQRSCGQGNIFTPVCHSLCSWGGGVFLSACWDTTPPWEQTPPWSRHPQSRHPQEQTPPHRTKYTPGTKYTPRTKYIPLGPGTSPPGKQTPTYGQRAAGTHPTGMHSCFKVNCCFKVHNAHLKVSIANFETRFRKNTSEALISDICSVFFTRKCRPQYSLNFELHLRLLCQR